MKKYEYRRFKSVNDRIVRDMRYMGEKGWELVLAMPIKVTPQESTMRVAELYFKREVEEERKKEGRSSTT